MTRAAGAGVRVGVVATSPSPTGVPGPLVVVPSMSLGAAGGVWGTRLGTAVGALVGSVAEAALATGVLVGVTLAT